MPAHAAPPVQATAGPLVDVTGCDASLRALILALPPRWRRPDPTGRAGFGCRGDWILEEDLGSVAWAIVTPHASPSAPDGSATLGARVFLGMPRLYPAEPRSLMLLVFTGTFASGRRAFAPVRTMVSPNTWRTGAGPAAAAMIMVGVSDLVCACRAAVETVTRTTPPPHLSGVSVRYDDDDSDFQGLELGHQR